VAEKIADIMLFGAGLEKPTSKLPPKIVKPPHLLRASLELDHRHATALERRVIDKALGNGPVEEVSETRQLAG